MRNCPCQVSVSEKTTILYPLPADLKLHTQRNLNDLGPLIPPLPVCGRNLPTRMLSREEKDTQNLLQGLVKKGLKRPPGRRSGIRLFVRADPECLAFPRTMPVGLGAGLIPETAVISHPDCLLAVHAWCESLDSHSGNNTNGKCSVMSHPRKTLMTSSSLET